MTSLQQTKGDSAADLFVQRLSSEQNGATNSSVASTSGIGGFLVCLDVPEGTEFGVDYQVFRTGPEFQGMKLLPLGLHFVVFRASEHQHGIRQGFFIRVDAHSQIIVREWSRDKEELVAPRPTLNMDALTHAVRSFQLDSGLGAYPQQYHKTWHKLSRWISDSVLKRCGVEFGTLLLPGDCHDASAASAEQEQQTGVAPYFEDLPRTVRFTRMRRLQHTALSGNDRTRYHFDRSAMVSQWISDDFDGQWKELLGEFQLAFVIFLHLSSLPALEQWKQLVITLCSCDQAARDQPPLFYEFIRVLHTQLQQISADFFDDELTSDNFLRPCLASLFEILADDRVDLKLRQRSVRLREFVASRFQLQHVATTSDVDEFAPVIVAPEELSSGRSDQDEDACNEAIALAFLAQQRKKS